MSQTPEVRITLAAYIYSIENDLKSMIKAYIVPNQINFDFFGNHDLVATAKERFLKDNIGLAPEDHIADVVEYVDFIDFIRIINKNKEFLPSKISSIIKKVSTDIEKIAPIRNRTMHTRPLMYGDFSTVHAFIVECETHYSDVFIASVAVLKKSNLTHLIFLH